MNKKYLAQIIATDSEGLQIVSACTTGAKVKVSDIKYLASNKVFLLSIERTKIEANQENKRINSICRFDYIDKVKSKNINQKKKDRFLDFLAIESLQMPDKNYEMNLIFSGDVILKVVAEAIEVTLDDQGTPWDSKNKPKHKDL